MKYIFYIILILPASLYPAFEPVGLKNDIMGMEGIYISPAFVCGEFGVSFNYILPFGMSELAVEKVAVRLPSKIGFFALRMSNFGGSVYRENVLSLGYGNSYRSLDFGTFIKMLYVSTKDFGSKVAISADIGLTAELDIGTAYLGILDITNPSINEDNLGSCIIGGLYLPVEDWFDVDLRIMKQENFPSSIRAVGTYHLAEFLNLNLGFDSYPHSFIGGMSIRSGRFGINYIISTHQELGLSHTIGTHFGSLEQ